MTTTRVTITMDDGVLQDAVAAAGEHGVSVSAWITRCTRLETMRDALGRHQEWCAAESLSGGDHDDRQSRLITDAAAELDRLADRRGHRASDAA